MITKDLILAKLKEVEDKRDVIEYPFSDSLNDLFRETLRSHDNLPEMSGD